jgi:hypothetical protein
LPTTRIPIKVLKRAAEALLPGPDVTRHEQRHGRKAKLTVLRDLMKADPAFRKRVRAFCSEDRSAESKAYAREMGWLNPNNQPALATDNAERDRAMWEWYRLTARFDLEHLGKPAPGMPTKWHTPDGDIELLTDEERAFALHWFNEFKAGRLHVVPQKLAAPEYIPSGTDWNEVDRLVKEIEQAQRRYG